MIFFLPDIQLYANLVQQKAKLQAKLKSAYQKIVILFLNQYLTYVVGTQRNHLNEMFFLST